MTELPPNDLTTDRRGRLALLLVSIENRPGGGTVVTVLSNPLSDTPKRSTWIVPAEGLRGMFIEEVSTAVGLLAANELWHVLGAQEELPYQYKGEP